MVRTLRGNGDTQTNLFDLFELTRSGNAKTSACACLRPLVPLLAQELCERNDLNCHKSTQKC